MYVVYCKCSVLYIEHPGACFCFKRSHCLGIYNLANHNKAPPAKLLLGKLNSDFLIQLVARKIVVNNIKIFRLKTQNSDGNQPSHFWRHLSYI